MLPIHKTLIKYIIAVMLVAGVVFVLLVYPQIERLRLLAADIEFKKKPLLAGRYPLESVKLQAGATALESRKGDLARKSRSTYDTVMGVLDPEVSAHHGIVQFTKPRVVSKLEFHNKFSIIESELRKQGVWLDPDVLGICKDTNSTWFYQLVSHISVVRTLVDMSKEHNLEICGPVVKQKKAVAEDQPEPEPESGYPARITVLPVKLYSITKDGEPYLVEFPVKIKVTGRLEDFCAFLLALTENQEPTPAKEGEEPQTPKKPRFIPVASVELNKVGLKDVVNSDQVEGTVVCSAFLIIQEFEKIAVPDTTPSVSVKKPLGI